MYQKKKQKVEQEQEKNRERKTQFIEHTTGTHATLGSFFIF